MTKRPYALPSLTQLASFEAAARHGSFKQAGNELNVTSSAVSHQIRGLENDLSTDLFQRRNRSVKLTPAGEQLFAALETSFAEIGKNCEELRALGAQSTVTIAATTAVSALWLSPRISRFLKENPEYRVNQELNDNPSKIRDRAHLQIHYGQPRGREDGQELFRDELVPVASAEFSKRYNVLNLPALARMPLIELVTDERGWTSWPDWFSELGYLGEINYSQKINNYLSALQAARDGAGAVLGWRQLLKPMLDRGELVVVTDYVLPAKQSFFLSSWEEDKLNDAAKTMREWLLNPAQQEMKFL